MVPINLTDSLSFCFFASNSHFCLFLCVSPSPLIWVPFCEHPSSSSGLISFHIADLKFPTVSDWHVEKCGFSLWLTLWNLREFESCPAGQGRAGGSLEDVWMRPPCLQGRRISAILTNCWVTKPLTCYYREVLCLCLTQSFEMYSVALAWGWWSGPSCWWCVCFGVYICECVSLCKTTEPAGSVERTQGSIFNRSPWWSQCNLHTLPGEWLWVPCHQTHTHAEGHSAVIYCGSYNNNKN